jgi:hypothetical protein
MMVAPSNQVHKKQGQMALLFLFIYTLFGYQFIFNKFSPSKLQISNAVKKELLLKTCDIIHPST